eukprot:7954184-Pyramimonas_sp.AAC.1
MVLFFAEKLQRTPGAWARDRQEEAIWYSKWQTLFLVGFPKNVEPTVCVAGKWAMLLRAATGQ